MAPFRECFGELLDRVKGHSIGLAVNRYGNFGDHLIQRATLVFFQANGIPCRILKESEITDVKPPQGVTLIAEPGGGNIGTRPGLSSPKRRIRLARIPCPKIILPQSASDSGEDLSAFETIFAREERTWEILRTVHSDVRLVPDMALVLDLQPSAPTLDEGLFFRRDIECNGTGGHDPVQLVSNLDEYIALAGNYRRVVTNRLHFAIAALLQGQAAILKPNSYHKNHSMYVTWLRHCADASWSD